MTLAKRFLDRVNLVAGRDQRLGVLAERLASVHGASPMVEEAGSGGRTLTFEQAAEIVDGGAGDIAAKVAPGDRVVLAVENGYDLLLLCLAVSRAGAIPVPVNGRMRPDEIEHVIGDSGAELVVRDASELDASTPLGHAAAGAED